MDRSRNGEHSSTNRPFSGDRLEAKANLERIPPIIAAQMQQGTARLHKKRSYGGARYTTPGPPTSTALAAQTARSSEPPIGASLQGSKARAGSIRTVMRKIFGRRSREPEPTAPPPHETADASPPRHQYHRSESSALPAPIKIPEPGIYQAEPAYPQPLFSNHQYPTTPLFAAKPAGSPYAVQFPKSAQLKPLDLGNPFAAPNNQLRRRKTLPTILAAAELDKDVAPLSATTAAQPPPLPPVPVGVTSSKSTSDIFARREQSARTSKRRSRSAEDIKRSAEGALSIPRKRSEEIQYWRDSVQDDLRRHGGAGQGYKIGEAIGEHEEMAAEEEQQDFEDPAAIGVARTHSFKSGVGVLSGGEQELDTSGAEFTQDLEDRVARLEAGLQMFQRSLQRLTTERNRRTVIMGNSPAQRSSEDLRTPSMLADTLQDFVMPATFQPFSQAPEIARRPSTSPREQTPARSDDLFTVDFPPLPPSNRSPEPLQSHPPHFSTSPIHASSRQSSIDQSNPPQPYTFHSLYQMLTDERSARRRLEIELRSMRDEISDLHSQVASSSSNIHSQRSSYLPTDPTAGSSRLRELLRETNTYPSPPQHRQQQRLSELSTSQPAISRFSASESDCSDVEEAVTPLDAYQTPTEERSRWNLATDVRQGQAF